MTQAQNQPARLNRVTIARPGGNDTAIVWDPIPRALQGAVSKAIQTKTPTIEQVMFVEDGENGLKRGQMAGGEFCANATRSLGFLLSNQTDGEVCLYASGAQTPVTVTVKNAMAQTSIPIKPSLESAQEDGQNYIVHLNGISFVITSRQAPLGQIIANAQNENAQKEIVMQALRSNGFATTYPASGIMLVERQNDGSFKLDPFVYVRDVNTLYYETGCGSGSTAIGVMLAKQTGLNIPNLKVTQPSGMSLLITIERNKQSFVSATVNGPIDIVFDGPMRLPERKNTQSPKQTNTQALIM